MKKTQASIYIITTLLFIMLASYHDVISMLIDNCSVCRLQTTSDLLLAASRVIALLTSPTAFIVVLLTGAVLAYETHHMHAWLHAVSTLLIIVTISVLFKEILHIPRPADQLRSAFSYSYPSTHAATGMGLYMLTRYHIANLSDQHWHMIHGFALSGLIVIIASRIILRVHTVSDIIGGLLLGYIIGQLAVSWWKNLYHKQPTPEPTQNLHD